jgi:hypothetical protein
MLSEAAGARLSKPRPPGMRRPSGRQQAPLADEQASHAPSGSATLQPSPLLNRAVHSSPGRAFDRDLDLDLPVDLAAALGRTSSAWPAHPRRRSSTATGEAAPGSAAGSPRRLTAETPSVGGSLGRRLGRKLSRALLNAADEHGQTAPDSDGVELPSLSLRSEDLRSDDTVKPGYADECELGASSDEELDEEWVGGLPREELEALLKQANQVIRERERDLGIAAAIGKALLDKNISLRSKHVGILTRLSSTINLNEQATYSPPTTDIDCNSQRGDLDDDETPMPTPTLSGDYFASQQAAAPSRSREHSHASPQRRPALDSVFARPRTPEGRSWQPSQAGLIASGSSSPANSQQSTASNRHRKTSSTLSSNAIAAAVAADAQRQLEMLSGQNDVLLAQLAELQDEAEEAKAAGSRRLRKLNREIEGLRGELEAATNRNDELERSGETESTDSAAEQKRKQWRRRSRNDLWSMTDLSGSPRVSDGSLPSTSPSSARLSAMLKADTERLRTDESVGGATGDEGGMPPSVSSAILGQAHGESASERALVAQLLAKIKELEDTNAALAQAGTEMDGRLGRALQEGERIRDAYDAVEASSAYGGDETFNETQHSLGGLSPSALRRRAAGNRHIIEGRRTIRAALRREASQSPGDISRSNTGSSLASSAASSAASSPRAFRKGRLGSGLTRPRILITPSMEDLAARRRQDAEWEQQQPFSAGSLGPNDARKYGATVSRKLRRASSSGSMASDGDGSRSSIELLMHGMSASPSADSSIDEAMSESATSVWNGRQTLGSELGDTSLQMTSELAHWTQAASGAQPGNDSDMQLSELDKPASNWSPARLGRLLRPIASSASLRAPSEAAESDIADLRWSVSSASTVVAAPQRLLTAGSDADQMLVPSLDFELQRQLSPAADGEWPDPNEELVPRGALRDDVMTNHESYDLLESATRLRPVHWADDDDFGQPITESEARRLGLLAAAKKSRTSLLGWVKKSDSASRRTGKGKMREGLPPSSSYRQIESAEQIDARERLTDLLRQKRLDGLKARVLAGQMDADKAVALGLDAEDADSAMARSLDREATARALAISPARHRRAMQQRQSPQQQQQRSVGRRVGAAMIRQQSYGSPSKGQATSSTLVRRHGEASDAEDKTGGSSDEQFELLDLDPNRQPSRRGMNFFPVDTRARYKPEMVKQRFKVASHDAATWATTWVSFTLMVVFAFLVTIRVSSTVLPARELLLTP